MLTYLAMPLALCAYLLGAWRLPSLAAYFAAAAWLAVPLSKALSVYVEYVLLVFAVSGVAFGVLAYVSYFQAKRTA